MANNQDLDNSVKFRVEYKWPKCNDPMQLQPNLRDYYGKPWWCHTCQWQYSEEDLKS